jgi:hypothetical protein
VRSRVAAAARAGHPLFWSANAEDVEDEHGDEEERREESPRPPLSPTSPTSLTSPRAHSSFRPIRAPSSPASHLSSPSTQRGATPPWGWQNTNRLEGHLFEKFRPASAPAARTSCTVQQRVASAPSAHRQTLSAHVSARPASARTGSSAARTYKPWPIAPSSPTPVDLDAILTLNPPAAADDFASSEM